MKILDRYIMMECLKAFLFAEVSFIGIYLVVDLFEQLNRFLEAEAGTTTLFVYYLFSLPGIALQVAPVAALLAALLSLGNLAKHHELRAMQMGRISTPRIVLPLLLLASLLSLAVFALGESVIPLANRKAIALYKTRVKKVPPYQLTRAQDLWYRASKNRFLHIALMETSTATMRDVTVYELRPDFTLTRRIVAKKASWGEGGWNLEEGYIFTLKEGGALASEPFRKLPLDLKETPQELGGLMRLPQEMNFLELRAYTRRLKESGIDASRYLVDLHAKGASAFAVLVMALIGAAFGLRVGRSGIMIWAGTCIPLGFVYWVLLSVGFALGKSGFLSAFLAAWLPNFFFTLGGIISIARLR
ncbi:MAG: LPS export ABC transporter permease LptG [candidate division NC10 bacterium]|nr:LPS export ABC transporter permease LptG [candidate division NC10 bacterium]